MKFFSYACALGALLLTSCMVGPKYQRPELKIPAAFSTLCMTNEIVDLSRWWTFFNDPVLEDLIKRAVKNNYDLRIAQEKILETRAFYGIQNANLFPEIDLTGQVQEQGLSQELLQNGAITKNTTPYCQIGFDASWELDIWGKLRRARSAAFNNYQGQIEQMRDVYIILLGDVAKTYLDCRWLQTKISELERLIAMDEALLTLNKDRFSGIDDLRAVATQESALHDSINQKIVLQESLQQTVIKLSILLGENPEEFTLTSGSLGIPKPQHFTNLGLPSDLLRRRPDIRQAERLLMAATDTVGRAIGDWFPSFSLLGGVATESNTFSKWFSGNSIAWSIGPSVRWPIIDFGRIRYNIKKKDSQRKQAVLAYAKSVVAAFGDVETSLVAYLRGDEQLIELKKKLGALNQFYDLTKSLFDSGLVNQLELINAEKNCLTVRFAVYDAEHAVSISLVSLYKALGGGW